MITLTLTSVLSSLPDVWTHVDLHGLTHIAGVLTGADGPPIRAENMIKEIAAWLTKILSAVALLFLVIDLFKHITASPRDLGAAGKDIFVMIILITIAAKAEQVVTWGQSLL